MLSQYTIWYACSSLMTVFPELLPTVPQHLHATLSSKWMNMFMCPPSTSFFFLSMTMACMPHSLQKWLQTTYGKSKSFQLFRTSGTANIPVNNHSIPTKVEQVIQIRTSLPMGCHAYLENSTQNSSGCNKIFELVASPTQANTREY